CATGPLVLRIDDRQLRNLPALHTRGSSPAIAQEHAFPFPDSAEPGRLAPYLDHTTGAVEGVKVHAETLGDLPGGIVVQGVAGRLPVTRRTRLFSFVVGNFILARWLGLAVNG